MICIVVKKKWIVCLWSVCVVGMGGERWGQGREGEWRVVGLWFRDVWRWPELKRATFWFWTGPRSWQAGPGHKAGWGLRIMAAEGRGGRQLANSAPICFHERGEEISEDAMPERHARRQNGRLKIKLVNILPVSPHDAHFSTEGGGGGHWRRWPFTLLQPREKKKKRKLTYN